MSDKPTIHDVARLAGLSTSSVSRALSGSRPVGPQVARLAKDAADRLGYRPDEIARSMRKKKTKIFGVVVPDLTNPFFPQLVQAVESECRAHDRGVLLVDTGDSSEIERQTIEMLLDRRIDALLVSPVHFSLSRPVLRAAAKRTTVIQLDRRADDELGFVQMDHADAMEQVIDHFRALRRTKLAFVGSNPSVSTSFDRQNAFMKLAQQSDPGATSRVVTGDFTVEWGRQAASDLMRRWPGIDGIVCADDLIALGVKQSLQGAGIAVPGRVGVVGFDDTIIASSGQLTSVRQPLADLARAVVSLCLSGEARTRAVHMSFRAELVVRASTDARHSNV